MFYGSKEQLKSKKKFEQNLWLIAHNGSGFDSYVVLNNLRQWRIVVNLIKTELLLFFWKNLMVMFIKTKKILNMLILDVEEFVLKIVWKK